MKPRSITIKLASTVCLLISLHMIILAVLGERYFSHEFREAIATQHFSLVSTLATQLDEQVKRSQSMLEQIATEIDRSRFSDVSYLQNCLDQEKDARTFYNGGFILIDTEGRIITESPARPARRGTLLAGRAYVANTLKTGKPQISSPYKGSLAPFEPTLTFTAPIFDKHGKLKGLLAGRHLLQGATYLSDLAGMKIGKTGYLYLLDRDRTLIMHPDKSRIMEIINPGKNNAVDNSLAGFEGSVENFSSRGISGITSIKSLSAAPWLLASHYPLKEAYAPIHRARTFFLYVVIAILATSMAAVWFFTRQFSRPLVALARHLRKMPTLPCDMREFAVSSDDEIGQFAASFNQMVKQLDEKEQELIREITETRRAEESLRIFSQALEQSASTIVITDTEGTIQYVNNAFCTVTGYSREEAIGQNPRILKSGKQPQEVYEDLWKTIKAGRQWHGEFHNKRKDGSFFWELITISPVVNQDREVLHYLAVKEDITTRKEQEEMLRKQQADLLAQNEELKHTHGKMLQQEKMASIGRLAGGIAHDFNNIMTGILGYVTLGLLPSARPEAPQESLAAIRGLAEKAAQLTKGLLSFSRSAPMDMKSYELNGIVRESLTILKRLVRDDIVVVENLAGSILPVTVDRTHIEEALLNVINNACDAMPDGGVLTITTALQEITDAGTLAKLELTAGQYAEISVHDTGKGIPETLQPLLFEPFFTTREVGKGSGLGLSIVYGIIKSHGGAAQIDSPANQGTTVRILLPVSNTAADQSEQHVPDSTQGGRETILVADDDPEVRKIITYTLQEFGYTVLETEDGLAALELLRQNGGSVDLALLDGIMPRMGGLATASAITEEWSGIRCIIMSGYGELLPPSHGENPWRGRFLIKPISPMKLLSAIREVIDS